MKLIIEDGGHRVSVERGSGGVRITCEVDGQFAMVDIGRREWIAMRAWADDLFELRNGDSDAKMVDPPG